MGYVILWVEVLAAALCWAAWFAAQAAHFERGRARKVRCVSAILIPLLVLGALTAGPVSLRLNGISSGAEYLWPLVVMLILFVGGAAFILRRALRPILPTGREDFADSAPESGTALRAGAAWTRLRLVLVLASLALVGLTLWILDLSVRATYVSLQIEAGAMALSVAPPRVPDSQNAALVYQRAFDLYEKSPEDAKLIDEAPSGAQAATQPGEDAKLRAALERQRPVIALLRQAGALPVCNFEHDYAHPSVDLLLPELTRLRNAARLLAADARVQAASGQTAEALADVTALWQLGVRGQDDPVLISQLVAIANHGLAVAVLQDVLRTAPVTAQGLAALRLESPTSFAQSFRRSLVMDEAFGLSLVGEIMSGTAPKEIEIPAWFTLPVTRIFLLQDEVGAYRRVMADFQRMADKPYWEARDSWRKTQTSLAALPRSFMVSMWAPTVGRVAEKAAYADASRDLAHLALAAIAYKLHHGQYPDKLAALVPEFIDAVPTDSFDGKPMKMAVRDGQLVLYSIGPDGKDDGGAPYDFATKTGDITFTLWP